MNSTSKVPRSLQLYRDKGYMVEKVEQRLPIPGRFVTRDLFGIMDLLAVSEEETVGVQVTSQTCVRKHKDKYKEDPTALVRWLKGPGRKYVMLGWVKKQGRWQARVHVASLAGENVCWVEVQSAEE